MAKTIVAKTKNGRNRALFFSPPACDGLAMVIPIPPFPYSHGPPSNVRRSPATAHHYAGGRRVQRVVRRLPRIQTQFAVLSPATRWKCLALLVTKIRPSDNA